MHAERPQTALRCTDLRSRYPGQEVYAVGSASVGVSFSVYRGEIFALLGPSGCGKTTTLRIIGGFIEPTTGRVEIEGNDVTRRQPYERPTNTVSANRQLPVRGLDIFRNAGQVIANKERVVGREFRAEMRQRRFVIRRTIGKLDQRFFAGQGFQLHFRHARRHDFRMGQRRGCDPRADDRG